MQILFKRFLASMLALSITWLGIAIPTAQAAMVPTSQVIEESSDNRAEILAFLDREQVQQELLDRGVDPLEAKARVANLSDDEAQLLAGHIDDLPAGGLLGEILGAAVLIFIVLLITDILGFTDVYPFVNHR